MGTVMLRGVFVSPEHMLGKWLRNTRTLMKARYHERSGGKVWRCVQEQKAMLVLLSKRHREASQKAIGFVRPALLPARPRPHLPPAHFSGVKIWGAFAPHLKDSPTHPKFSPCLGTCEASETQMSEPHLRLEPHRGARL